MHSLYTSPMLFCVAAVCWIATLRSPLLGQGEEGVNESESGSRGEKLHNNQLSPVPRGRSVRKSGSRSGEIGTGDQLLPMRTKSKSSSPFSPPPTPPPLPVLGVIRRRHATKSSVPGITNNSATRKSPVEQRSVEPQSSRVEPHQSLLQAIRQRVALKPSTHRARQSKRKRTPTMLDELSNRLKARRAQVADTPGRRESEEESEMEWESDTKVSTVRGSRKRRSSTTRVSRPSPKKAKVVKKVKITSKKAEAKKATAKAEVAAKASVTRSNRKKSSARTDRSSRAKPIAVKATPRSSRVKRSVVKSTPKRVPSTKRVTRSSARLKKKAAEDSDWST